MTHHNLLRWWTTGSVAAASPRALSSALAKRAYSAAEDEIVVVGRLGAGASTARSAGYAAWPQTCLIYLYDEHGGYYDHVAPPAAIPPDDIPPVLGPGDPELGYDHYGPRVPAIVVSPYSRPGGSTNVDHDHTSVLATIEAKWNLPALTRRDANATTIEDFFAPGPPALLTPQPEGAVRYRKVKSRRRKPGRLKRRVQGLHVPGMNLWDAQECSREQLAANHVF